MNKLKVFISGQKYFGQEVLRLCLNHDNIDVVGVCCPLDDRYIGDLARTFELMIIPAGELNHENLPQGVDLGITAHSFDYIGRRTRYKTRLGWIGYHPSLLPLHRGRSSIEWVVRMGERITGGTVFWLNSGIDRGDIAYQEFVILDPKVTQMAPKEAAKRIWKSELLPMGLRLFKRALNDISNGVQIRRPQRHDIGTFEPSTETKDVFKPDLLMIEEKGSKSS